MLEPTRSAPSGLDLIREAMRQEESLHYRGEVARLRREHRRRMIAATVAAWLSGLALGRRR